MHTYKRSPMSPAMRTISYWLEGCLLALTVTLILEGALGLHLALGWLISINVFTLMFYWIDKINSIWANDNKERKAKKARIPEPALLLLALVGGSPAAALAILFLPHKTNESWFLIRFLLILVAQGITLYLFWDQLPWS